MIEPTSIRIGVYEVVQDGKGWAVWHYTDRPKKDKLGNETGTFVVSLVGYYSTFENCLRRLVEASTEGKGRTTPELLLGAIETSYMRIHAALQAADPAAGLTS